MREQEATAIATELLIRESRHLDDREWDRWLAMYAPAAVFWVPAWRDDEHETSDPNTEISQIYHEARHGLEERVARVRSGQSVTALPLPRTTHFITNTVALAFAPDVIEARANWLVQVYQPRTATTHANFGYYELRYTQHQGAWLITSKKIHLKNDVIPAVIDFYTL
ncbi:MAG: aromatic-ring-hydroxylating dioxygenase subunit beta [Gammaproteobacteria bacterium]|nr:aromatic-ring-hydroxylating dioxygenase subunit beta [Gammaproteobacteria bacterium]